MSDTEKRPPSATERHSMSSKLENGVHHKEAVEEGASTATGWPKGVVNWLGLTGVIFGYISMQLLFFMPQTVQAAISADLGPRHYIYWIGLGLRSVNLIFWVLSGSISDKYGRRIWIIGGFIVTIIGSIVCVSVDTTWKMILGTLIAGIGNGQLGNAVAIISEVVPAKHRALAQGLLACTPLPFIACSHLIGAVIMKHTTWKWVYYTTIIINSVGLLLTTVFYHPPPRNTTVTWRRPKVIIQAALRVDWIGFWLLTFFTILLCISLLWAGFQTHAWDSPAVLVTLLLGFASLISLAVWENWGARRPLFPKGLFHNIRGFSHILGNAAFASFGYAAVEQIYPTHVQLVYEPDTVRTGVYLLPSGFGQIFGALLCALLARRIGHTQIQLTVITFLLAVFVGLLATLGPHNIKPGHAFTFLAEIMRGYNGVLAIVMAQFGAQDRWIATATAALTISMSMGLAFTVSFFYTIINSVVGKDLGKDIAAAVLPLGLPMTSLPLFIQALASGEQAAILQVPGITMPIIFAGALALKKVYLRAFRICYFLGMASSLLATFFATMTRDVTPKMDEHVAVDMAKGHRAIIPPKPTEHVEPNFD